MSCKGRMAGGCRSQAHNRIFFLVRIQTWILMNEHPLGGIQPSHLELGAQCAEAGPAVVWARPRGFVL